ncbi:hypothetical protein Sjap_008270 [Stephania japonica]|uniref:Uncharacterized protein n=1 Tax=Stephania japonica TaxID=461633 RepID=A0AAP0JP63_9MAGN
MAPQDVWVTWFHHASITPQEALAMSDLVPPLATTPEESLHKVKQGIGVSESEIGDWRSIDLEIRVGGDCVLHDLNNDAAAVKKPKLDGAGWEVVQWHVDGYILVMSLGIVSITPEKCDKYYDYL